MKKNHFTSILQLSIGCLILCITSCSKDEDAKPSKTTLLTAHVWVFNEASADNELSVAFAEAVTLGLAGTEVTMNKNGTYQIVGPTTSNGTWKLNADETAIIFNEGTSNEGTSEILKLDATNWWYPYADEDTGTSLTLKYVKK